MILDPWISRACGNQAKEHYLLSSLMTGSIPLSFVALYSIIYLWEPL